MRAATTTVPPTGPLSDFTIGVTATRHHEELVALLSGRGARVIEAPTMRIVPPSDDTALRRATERCLTAPLDFVVATTGAGWHSWMSAADGWGTGARLVAACRDSMVVSRGPKATAAVRDSGLDETFSTKSDADDELLAWLLARPLWGRRVAVQEHSAPLNGYSAALRERGAEVIEVPVYRWGPPEDLEAVRRLVELTVRRELHVLTFTSAPALEALMAYATQWDRYDEVLAALRTEVLVVCVGPVCARPLADLGVETICPDRGRLGSLVRTLTESLPDRLRREVRYGAETVVLQGSSVIIDGAPVATLSPVPAALLRALAERPGHVLSRAELLCRVWPFSNADEHAVETAVARLRAALGPHSALVRTVPKRGYRLAVAL